jgi:murein tripeptide amidase MpaA
MISISSAFDGGNIEIVSARDPSDIRLRIRPDAASEHRQWFCFRASGQVGDVLEFRIEGLDTSSYPDGWTDYQAVVSSDEETWTRINSSYDSGVLTFTLSLDTPRISVAYFAPYSLDRKDSCVSKALTSGRFRYDILGQSIDGRDMECLQFGKPSDEAPVVWIIARQHPGETMASWWMEGALEFLSDGSNPVANALMENLCLYLVPLMNPDGAYRGHLRTNTAGTDLNRAWAEPDLQTSPEVYHVRKRMDETGARLFLDVHGDEALPYNFIDIPQGIPSWSPEMEADARGFVDLLAQLNPDFQTEHGYPPTGPGEANLAIANSQIAERFGALSMTLEMPFKDSAITPDTRHGWSPNRCKHLAHSCLQAIFLHLGKTEHPA